jgi:rod shape determining protein RodA
LDTRLFRNFDTTLLLITLAIIGFGCAMIYSASQGGRLAAGYVEKQIVFGLVGIVAGTIVASIDHVQLARHSGKLYTFCVALLLAVLFLGHESKGAQRWIAVGGFQFQPSELAKFVMIIALASLLVKRHEDIRSVKTFVFSFAYLALPLLLIFKQPDLGTSLVLIAVWITMLFVVGTDLRNIAVLFGVGIVLGVLAWTIPGVMKDYQKERVLTFIYPERDPQGSGYHVKQARIAIGSGQFTGKGFLKGTQRGLNFIPEQHTDFIFTVVGEETGFVGAAGLVLLYAGLIWRGLNIMSATEDITGRAMAAGVVGMFGFHVAVNMGMTLGILPVTGVPLPMFSYGGTSLVTNLMCIGLLEGISMRRHRINF